MIDESDRQRLAEIRAAAASERLALETNRPDDPLEAVAWLAGLSGQLRSEPLMEAIGQARSARFEWKEIAEAAGRGQSASAARRMADQFKFWASQQK